MKTLLLITIVLLNGCSKTTETPPKFKFGQAVAVEGFYSSCKGMVVYYFKMDKDNNYSVILDCPQIKDYIKISYRESDLTPVEAAK